jgi:hypothetical protein
MLTMHAADLNLILNLILRLFENTKFKFNENCLKTGDKILRELGPRKFGVNLNRRSTIPVVRV